MRLDPPPRRVVLLGAGGWASTVLLHGVVRAGVWVSVLSCDFGGQPARGVDAVTQAAVRLGCEHRRVDLSPVTVAIASPWAGPPAGVGVLAGVPNGMSIALAIGVAAAVTRRCDAVLIGAHADDPTLRPDCDPAFLAAVTAQAIEANPRLPTDRFRVSAPLATMSGAAVIRFGVDLAVPFEETWSCYQRGPLHCGACSGCWHRRGAFAAANVIDPVTYADQHPAEQADHQPPPDQEHS